MTTALVSPDQRNSGSGNDHRAVLMSIQPRHVEKILAGTKTVELRRTAPSVAPGSHVVLYSSSPVKAIVGAALISRIDSRSPSRLWEESGHLSGVTRAEFRRYFDGAVTAFGLHLDSVVTMAEPLALSAIREFGLEPPQSWRYLDSELAAMISARVQP